MTDEIDPPRRQERQEVTDRKWKEQPAETYIAGREGEMLERDLKREVTVIEDFKTHLEENVDVNDMGIRIVCEQDIRSYINEVLDPDTDKSDKQGEFHLKVLNRLYNRLQKNRAIGDNPVSDPLTEYRRDEDRDLEPPDRPYIPFKNMCQYVNWLTRPISRALVVPGLKYGTRTSEVTNIDLRCLNIAHPVFQQIIEEHNVTLDPRVRNKPDSLVIYEGFTKGEEIPNEDTPGVETEGEVRDGSYGNKRKEEGGSILPIDSEFKTALIEWLLMRPPTYSKHIHPLYVIGAEETRRISYSNMQSRLWTGKSTNHVDAIRLFGEQRSIDSCPKCGDSVQAENLEIADKTGRRYYCPNCQETHWRTIMWDDGLSTPQKVTYHQFRHYFSDAHRVGKSEIHEGAMPEFIRKKRIRGDSTKDEDTDDSVYRDKQYQNWEKDVREPYLDAVYKFNLYDEVIPAVGEGWKQ